MRAPYGPQGPSGSPVRKTLRLPGELWKAVQVLAADEGNANNVIVYALEEYISATRKRHGRHRPGKYQHLVKALSTPVAALRLSARPATTLRTLNITYVYELVQKSPRDLFGLPNFGEKSLREIKEKLAALGLSLGMTLEDESYRAAVVATVAASIQAAKERCVMHSRRILILNPDNEPEWVRLHVYPVAERWAAAILADNAPPPEPDSLRGMAFFGETPEDAEQRALEYLGEGVA